MTNEPNAPIYSGISVGGSPSIPGKLRLPGTIKLKDSSAGEPAAGQAAPQKRRAAFYFDGFNLYHALKNLGDKHLRWLDLRKLSEALINKREEEVVKVIWCSAEYRRDTDKIMRHRAYVNALRAVNVVPLLGHFVPETRKCQASCKEEFQKDVEKCGDVNVAIYVVADGLQDVYDHCYLVTADSDQVATVDLFRNRIGAKRLTIVAPPGREHSKHILDRGEVHRKTITRQTVEACLFERQVRFPDGSLAVERPDAWSPPRNWRRPTPAAAETNTIVSANRRQQAQVERKKSKSLNRPRSD